MKYRVKTKWDRLQERYEKLRKDKLWKELMHWDAMRYIVLRITIIPDKIIEMGKNINREISLCVGDETKKLTTRLSDWRNFYFLIYIKISFKKTIFTHS